jgi:hypothetical protein
MKEALQGTRRSGWERFSKRRRNSDELQMTYDLRNAEKALPAGVRKSIEENRSTLA